MAAASPATAPGPDGFGLTKPEGAGMTRRPYVLSAAMSADGYIDDRSASPLVLSGPEDADRVDELRSLTPSGVLLAPRVARQQDGTTLS